MSAPAHIVNQRAAEYGVTARTVRNWRSAGAPLADAAALAEWLRVHDRLPDRAARVGEPVDARIQAALATDWSALESADLAQRRGDLETWSALAGRKMRAALDAEAHGEFTRWQKIYLAFHGAALQARLAQAKLGIDTGDLVTRVECERILHAFINRLCLGIQHTRDHLAARLTNIPFETEIADHLETALITRALLDPVNAALAHAAAIGLPPWVPAACERAIADHLAAGLDQLAARRAQTLTDPQA
jgi:hypothetical protein